VHDDAVPAELRPAGAAVRAEAAALVVVVHHALARRRLLRADPGPPRGDDAARLVAGDDEPARAAEAQRRGGIAGGPVGMQVAAAHPRRLDREHDLARPRRGVGDLTHPELAVAQEDDALPGQCPLGLWLWP